MAYPRITIVGAGQVGATAAFLLLTNSVADVVLIDVAEGMPQGKALDMMHSRSVERFGPVVTGTNDYADTAGSDLVVITAGLARKPGMSRDDLLAANAAIVRSVVADALAASPDATLLLVTNPLDIMTYLAMTAATGVPASRVLGMGGVLDSARFAFAIAEATGEPIGEIDALVVGAHGEGMLPLPRHSTVAGRPLPELLSPERIDEVARRTIEGGAEVVALLKTGSAYYAPGASVARMAAALLGETPAVLPSCVWLGDSPYAADVCLSVPAALSNGRWAIEQALELDEAESAAFAAAVSRTGETLDSLGLR